MLMPMGTVTSTVAVLTLVVILAVLIARVAFPRLPQLRGVALQFSAALALCILSTAQPILMELAKARNPQGKAPFHTPSMVFYTEGLKTLVALATYCYQLPGLDYTGLEALSMRNALPFAVPALCYFLSNNINYFALQLIDPPTYQLWGCAKLAFAGVFFRVLLGRELTARKWVALGLLAIGMAITTLKTSKDDESRASLRGIAMVLCTAGLSGASAVFNEWLIKFQDPQAPLMLKNLLLYLFGTLMCLSAFRPRAPIGDPPLFATLVVVQAMAGFCVSFVLKYCDSLVKGFSTSAAVLSATVVSAALFGFELRAPFVAGTTVVCVAFYMYFHTPSPLT